MPKSPIFSQLFARSPISPIQDHMKVAVDAAAQLNDFFAAVFDGDWQRANEIRDKISALESEADEIKRNIRSSLPRSIFMPVSRSDLLELLQNQDRVPNRCQDVVGLCVGREMSFPESLQGDMREFVAAAVATVGAAGTALNELDELLETGFSGSEVDLVERMIKELVIAEHKTAELQRKVQQGLYQTEKEINPVDVMFMYRLIEWLGDIADYAQSVGNRMLYLIAK